MTSITRAIPVLVIALILATPVPVDASTSSELKELKEEVRALREGQRRMQKDLADIKKLLEQGARAAPGPQAFKPADFVVGDSPTRGAADAPVTLVEFSDYQCPFCKRHATTVMPDLIKEYIDTGKVRFVMREFPIENIHKNAKGAAQAGLCANEQGKYWEMHDLMFANQGALLPENLKAHAVTLGLDVEAFNSCLDSGKHSAQIAASLAEGQKYGISGTPSFVAGLTDPKDSNKVRLTKFIRGAQPLTGFKATLEELLKEAGK